MIFLTLFLERGMEALHAALAAEEKRLTALGAPLKARYTETETFWIWRYVVEDAEKIPRRRAIYTDAFYRSVADCMQQYYFGEYAAARLREIVARDYGYFGCGEQAEIFASAQKLLNDADISGYYRRVTGEALIAYLHGSHLLHVGGFLRFRMKAYGAFLTKVADLAADSYAEMAEYREFIGVLRYFVASNAPSVALLHVVRRADGYALLDGDGRALQETAGLPDGAAVKQEEALLSALINCSPSKVVFHRQSGAEDEELARLLRQIFAERFFLCGGCALCRTGASLDSDSAERYNRKTGREK